MDPPDGLQYVVLMADTQYPHLYQAGEVDGGPLLDISLLGPEHDGLGLDDPQEHPVLHVRRGAHLKR